jgi:hypothetical protein
MLWTRIRRMTCGMVLALGASAAAVAAATVTAHA